MPLFAFENTSPTVHPDAWIAPTATLVGDVRIEAEASVWYGAVLRAEFGPIIVRARANVQDGARIGDRAPGYSRTGRSIRPGPAPGSADHSG